MTSARFTLAVGTVILMTAAACLPSTSGSNNSSSGDACPAGQSTCVCKPDNTCDPGLVCSAGRCIPGTNGTDGGISDGGTTTTDGGGGSDGGVTVPVTLVASAAGARACEAVLHDSAHAITALSFASGVEGRSLRRGERLAVAFAARSDATLPADGVQVRLQTVDSSLTGITLSNNRCFDAQGAAISGASVELVDQR